jgi:hypothetical protein
VLFSRFIATSSNILTRIYDCIIVAGAFAVSYDLLDKTRDLETMRWLFVSYKATKRRGVPVFIQMLGKEIALEGSASSQRFRKALGERSRASDISIRLLNSLALEGFPCHSHLEALLGSSLAYAEILVEFLRI